jgi:hypothetical protein
MWSWGLRPRLYAVARFAGSKTATLLRRLSDLCKPIVEKLQMDDSATDSNGNRLRAVTGAEFFHDVFDVHFDSFF